MMKFIHKLTIVLALGGICGLAACSDDDQGFLKRNLREMSFPYVESSDTFTIRATGDWYISDTPDSREWTNAYGWVHVDQLLLSFHGPQAPRDQSVESQSSVAFCQSS